MSSAASVALRLHAALASGDLDQAQALLGPELELMTDQVRSVGMAAIRSTVDELLERLPGVRVGAPEVSCAWADTVLLETPVAAARGWPMLGTSCDLVTVRDGRVTSVRHVWRAADEADRRHAAQATALEEQGVLRHIATLIAKGVPDETLFASVNEGVARIVAAESASLTRFEPDDTLTILAGWTAGGGGLPVGERRPLNDEMRQVRQTGEVRRFSGLPDGAPFVEEARTLGIRWTICVPIQVEGRVWGASFVSSGSADFPLGTEARIRAFTELVATALANADARARVQRLADEQSALRRIAEVAAGGVSPQRLFDAVVQEAWAIFGVEVVVLATYEEDDSSLVVAARGAPPGMGVGTMGSGEGDGVAPTIRRTGRPAFVGDYRAVSGHGPQMARKNRFSCGAGAPVVIKGRIWGALIAVGTSPRMVPGVEHALADFTELLATAMENVHARAELERRATEQAALGEVAALVARGVGEQELFAKVALQASRLVDDQATTLIRRDDVGGPLVVAEAGKGRASAGDGSLSADELRAFHEVVRTGCSSRHDGFGWLGLGPEDDEPSRQGSYVAAPIVVDDRTWGVLVVSRRGRPLPVGAEDRVAKFTELVAAAVANAENRERLFASRARVVAAADEARRRIQRDLHDGAQQRMMHTVVALDLATSALADGDLGTTAAWLTESLQNAHRAKDELRDLVHGILPATLTHAGLRACVEEMAAALPLSASVAADVPRLGRAVETTAYFVVSEALANVVKHAEASRVEIRAEVRDDALEVTVRDDGVGGADRRRGSGLTGLADRVEARGGSLSLSAHPESGTVVRATIPLGASPESPPPAAPQARR